MKRFSIEGTDLEVSRLCLGTMTFGAQVDAQAARGMLRYAFDHGINFVDTSNNYNHGESERILGKELGAGRDQIILASKVFNRFGDAEDQRGLSRPAIHKALEATLKRLRTEYLDVYYFHAPDYAVPLEESLTAMDELVRAGKVRYVGASNYASWQLTRLHWIAEKEGLPCIRIGQPMYNLIARGIEQEYLPACRELGVANVAYNPLAGGLLTGKHINERPVEGSRFDTNQQYFDRYWFGENFNAIKTLKEVACGADRSLISLALNWLLHHSETDGVILGASSLEQLQANLNAAQEGALSKEVVAACDQVWARLRGASPVYNR